MIALFLLFAVSATAFSALGQGGGAFYVPLLLAWGIPFHAAAAASQAVIMAVSASAMVVFHRAGFLDWKLILLVEPATNLGAFSGGYLSRYVSGSLAKVTFAAVLVGAAFFMLRPVAERASPVRKGTFYWTRTLGGETYSVNWAMALPMMAVAGFLAGMLGVGGGILKVPLLVLACGIPMRVAVGTSALMVGLTALTGLLGHGLAGNFDYALALPLAAAGFLGAQVGSRLSLSVDKHLLKRAFGLLLLGIAVLIVVSVVRAG